MACAARRPRPELNSRANPLSLMVFLCEALAVPANVVSKGGLRRDTTCVSLIRPEPVAWFAESGTLHSRVRDHLPRALTCRDRSVRVGSVMQGAFSISRRQAVAGLGASCLDALSEGAIREQIAVDEIAPGVFFRFGVHEETSTTNRGAIANTGFVIGRDAVAVIDPGGSLEDGCRLRAAIRRVTGLPIRYVVMTHGHPDHVFGAGAFRQDAPSFVGHHRLPSMLAARGEFYQRRLEATLGEREAGPIVMPTMLVQGRMDLDLGSRTLGLTAHPPAHTDCDLSVRDSATNTLMLGDLLFVRRVPSLDGSLRGWIRELQLLQAQRIKAAVPGHGPTRVAWPRAAEPLERYLGKLLSETREAIRRGLELEAAVSTIALSERGEWLLFDDYNGHNITQAYKELEWEPSPGDPSR